MAPIRRLVIDVLKPHDPPLVRFTEELTEVESVDGATGSLIELDQEVQNVKVTLEGDGLSLDAITGVVEELGGSVHSVDLVACGEYVVEDADTLQD